MLARVTVAAETTEEGQVKKDEGSRTVHLALQLPFFCSTSAWHPFASDTSQNTSRELVLQACRVGGQRAHLRPLLLASDRSPLLQFAKQDEGKTFVVVPCPAGTGQMIQRLTDNEIDVSMYVLCAVSFNGE